MEYLKQIIAENYNIQINSITQTRGGWSADAYIVNTDEADYFVKVYDKQRPAVQPWISRMGLYMPLVLWLHGNTALRERMTAPLLTINNTFKIENERFLLLLFPLLKGVSMGDTHINVEQVRQLAAILGELHTLGSGIPLSTAALEEDYTLPFLKTLRVFLEVRPTKFHLDKVLNQHADKIKSAMALLQELAVALHNTGPQKVLCHADVHGGNLMWTDKIVLVDWEGLRLAPAEADLFVFTDGFFFDYAQDEFMAVYRSIRSNYQVNGTALRFYRLRRRIEDISEFAQSITHDNLNPQDLRDAMEYLNLECSALSAML